MTSAARISNEVGDVAALVSLSLALLTFFTTRRAERLRRDLERGAGDVGKRALADLAADAALAAATIVVLWLLEPLFADAFDTSRLGVHAQRLAERRPQTIGLRERRHDAPHLVGAGSLTPVAHRFFTGPSCANLEVHAHHFLM